MFVINQNMRRVVSTDTVSATSLTSSTLRRLIEKFTLGKKKQDFHHFLRGVLLIVKQNNWAMEEKNTIRDGDTTALYTVLTAYTVYNVNTVSTVYTIRNCFTLFKQ